MQLFEIPVPLQEGHHEPVEGEADPVDGPVLHPGHLDILHPAGHALNPHGLHLHWVGRLFIL